MGPRTGPRPASSMPRITDDMVSQPTFVCNGEGSDGRMPSRSAMHQDQKGRGKYNVVVIGAGTAGLVTAAGTAGLGGRVALIEGKKMGGDCLNFGCVPSKALISSAKLVHRIPLRPDL